jgi:DNA-directed RNA polymerase subunit M/transcription elongation factor TFIIS
MTQVLIEGCKPSDTKPSLIGRRAQCNHCGTVIFTDKDTKFVDNNIYTSEYRAVACPTCEKSIAVRVKTDDEYFESAIKDVRKSMYQYASDGGQSRRELKESQDHFNEKIVFFFVLQCIFLAVLALGVAYSLGWIQ